MAQHFAVAARFLAMLADEGLTDADLLKILESPDAIQKFIHAINSIVEVSDQERSRMNDARHSARVSGVDTLSLGAELVKKLQTNGFNTVNRLREFSIAALRSIGFAPEETLAIKAALLEKDLNLDPDPPLVEVSLNTPMDR